MNKDITNSVVYVGTDDKDIGLFESQYAVPNGVSYNSYLIKDEKYAVMDTVDSRKNEEWLKNLEQALDGHTPDYLIVQHMEPDHSGSMLTLIEKYPDMKIVGNAKTFAMIKQFFELGYSIDDRTVTVKNGDTLSLGTHTLTFVFAPMVHWPEVMVTYESSEKILFSADGFGKFGTLDTDEPWDDEARRYYINIVGKYGAQVQALLKKASSLDIEMICPLHGPVLTENLGYYIGKYDVWSSYRPEKAGVLVAYASIHGNTAEAAKVFAAMLTNKTDDTVEVLDLARCGLSYAVAEAFRYDKMVLACASYDGGMFPCMEDFLSRLSHKGYKNRTVGIIENGTWAPSAGKAMTAVLENMKGITLCENKITIKSTLKRGDLISLEALADELAQIQSVIL